MSPTQDINFEQMNLFDFLRNIGLLSDILISSKRQNENYIMENRYKTKIKLTRSMAGFAAIPITEKPGG